MPVGDESEWKTRKQRIDPRLDSAGWKLGGGSNSARRTEEEKTANGPADYALWLDRQVAAVVEAKKVTVGPQNVLTQAERYARGLIGATETYGDLHCPFLYATNGEVFWFHDVRHPLNRSRRVADFHTPSALREMLSRDLDAACERLLALPNDAERLRPYQRDGNTAIERAIADRKRELLVAMATGTGKTYTMVNQIYRLLKCGVARRVLFLVDRRALAAQAVRAFSSFDAEPGLKFDKAYEVYSSRFQTGDFSEEEKFDPKTLQSHYLTDPKPGQTFVYVCTIQRMAINVLGAQAVFAGGEEVLDEDLKQLQIPIHAFDVIVADECHRGYTASEVSVWRDTLEHFDAIKIGLTATPASHTTSYFKNLVYRYDYPQAVRDGFLVDYDVVTVHSDVHINGLFLKEGEQVDVIDPTTGLRKRDQLEDEREFAATEIESKITAPESNRLIVEELKKYALEHEQRYGRFPKTLIFAANDLPHTSHCDQLVTLCREAFGRGDAFIDKITGKVDRPLQRIREFRNRPNPGIAVTVDLLTTGIDIPDLEFLVFLRPVKSRILFEQMLGRGTRRGENHTDKSHFTVFDCFDGDLLRYFKETTGITAEAPDKPARPIAEIIDDVWSNRDRSYNIGCLVKRLQRIDKQMAGEAREIFAAFIPEGDVARYAKGLTQALASDFVGAMKLLRDPRFQDLLVTYPRPPRRFLVAYDTEDQVTSKWLVRDGDGNEYKPEAYLAVFERFVRENPEHIQAIGILLGRPREWGPEPLSELKVKLAAASQRFTIENLQRAHKAAYSRDLVDIISMVKHAADGDQPLLTAAERVERAFEKVTAGQAFTPDQQQWLDRIREHLRQNLSIEEEDFDAVPIFSRQGGRAVVRKLFGPRLPALLHDLNEALAA